MKARCHIPISLLKSLGLCLPDISGATGIPEKDLEDMGMLELMEGSAAVKALRKLVTEKGRVRR